LHPPDDSRRAAAREGVDDDHAASAAGAGLRECSRLPKVETPATQGFRHVEELTGSRHVLDERTVGEQTVVADAMEARGQHVHQEATDEYAFATHFLHPIVLSFPSVRFECTINFLDGERIGRSS
jgi:hypothetical protein